MATAALYNKEGFGRVNFYGKWRKPACKSKAVAPPSPIKKRKIRSPSPPPQIRSSSNSSNSSDYSQKRRKIEEVNLLRHTISDVVPGCGSVDDYEKLNEINSGSFGVVYRVRDKRSGEIAAMKDEIEGLTVASLREIEILKSLPRHRSIVEMKEVLGDAYDGVYVVMEYVEFDLRRYAAVKGGVRLSEIKHVMKELLEGVKFLHDNMVMHRDIKPPNILVDGRGAVKICDFGLSRRMKAGERRRYSLHAGTLAYQAPEMLQGKRDYSTAVDMWGVGCTMAELLLKRQLFGGQQTQAEQLLKIYGVLGPPGFGAINDLQLRKEFGGGGAPLLTDGGFDLLRRLLSYDPSERITAEAALRHVWFQE